MKNKGIKIGVVFILLFALLSVAGCQQEDVVIVGVEPGQPGPTSGQLRISFAPVSSSASIKLSPNITINDLSLSADTSFTVTNTDTSDTTVLTGAVIDTDPTFTYVNFDEDDDILPASTRVSILIPYTLEPGNYEVTAVTGSVKYPSSSGTSVENLHLARDGDGLNTTFTIAAPELTPTPEPAATPTVEPTATPTVEPTATPTAEPTATPTAEPTATPTAEPTATPTAEPTATPTAEPTATPTAAPTAVPTAVPTATPSPTNHPKTGDDFAPALWLTLCAGSLAALALLLKKRHI
ncbi:hypothetical protein [Hominenteromicrobium sp.]|uniref:hypothetical protein n=1 Tax=Hominenteromicrobium sp. TaxID=3073581 RepID=UPI003AF14FF5